MKLKLLFVLCSSLLAHIDKCRYIVFIFHPHSKAFFYCKGEMLFQWNIREFMCAWISLSEKTVAYSAKFNRRFYEISALLDQRFLPLPPEIVSGFSCTRTFLSEIPAWNIHMSVPEVVGRARDGPAWARGIQRWLRLLKSFRGLSSTVCEWAEIADDIKTVAVSYWSGNRRRIEAADKRNGK